MAPSAAVAMRCVTPNAETLSGDEGASETFLAGTPLVSDGSGRLEEDTTDPANIVGLSLGPGHNTSGEADEKIDYVPAWPEYTFLATVAATSAAAALTQTMLDAEMGVTESGGIYTLDSDKSDGSTSRARIIKAVDEVGDEWARVLFKWTLDQIIIYDT